MSLIRINTRPSPRQLLLFAVAWLGFVGVLGWILWTRSRPTAALTCWILAAAVPAAGTLWPAGLRLLYVGLSYATYPIGFVVSSLVLVAIYYAVLTPIGLILRLCGHDALQQRFEPGTTSYWRKRPSPPPDSYFRQH